MLKFLDQGESFMNYKRPVGKIDQFSEETITKSEAVRRHSLMSTIFEDDANDLVLPFEFAVED